MKLQIVNKLNEGCSKRERELIIRGIAIAADKLLASDQPDAAFILLQEIANRLAAS